MRKDPTSLLTRILRRSPGDWFCISVKNPAKPSGSNWKDHFFKRTEISKIKKFIQNQKGKDLYFCPHGFSKPKRLKEFAVKPHLCFADLDECKINEIPLKPTVALESSPGRYVGFWYTDKEITEDLNRRLSYFVKADVSGWDFTQVLRVPGTRNHKYKSKPLVKVKWDDGPHYQLERLGKMVPEVHDDEGREHGGEAQDIYEEYEEAMSRKLRKELTNPIPKQGKRSEVIWMMIQECVEIGMRQEEILTLLWDNAWNKFKDRRGGEKLFERQISKALGQHVGGSKKLKKTKKKTKKVNGTKSKKNGSYFNLITMDKVTQEKIDWIVPQMIAPGQTTMIEGDPGVGKSYFLMWMAIHFCDGKPLPWDDERRKLKPMRVAYLDTENAMGAVTKTRLLDNNLVNQQNYLQVTEGFSLDDPDSVDAFEEEVIQGWKPDVVIVDPITLYLGGADSYKASDVQQALANLKDMAAEYGFALILVRHLNKSHGGKALYAGNGSIGFAGLARVVATVGWHPDEPDTRVVACTKNNLSPPFGSLGYTIEPLPSTMDNKYRSRIEYVGRVDYTADDIVGTINTKEDNAITLASDLIKELMGEGGEEVNYHKLVAQADKRSISERSVKKAAAEMGLKKLTKGRGKTRQTFLVQSTT